MKRFREFLGKPAVTAVLFALAVIMLAGGAIGGTRAALNIQSEYYNSEVEILNIGVALVEENVGGDPVVIPDGGKLMGDNTPIAQTIKSEGKFYPGKKYPEVLAVQNTGDIKEYVRVAVFKYWLDEKGNKFSEMNSNWIELGFVTGKGWTIDTDKGSSTEERTILYYDKALDPGEVSSPFLESVTINNIILTKVSQKQYKENGVTVIETTFIYNGKQFCIQVLVDGVQDHNAEKAKISAWGVNK